MTRIVGHILWSAAAAMVHSTFHIPCSISISPRGMVGDGIVWYRLKNRQQKSTRQFSIWREEIGNRKCTPRFGGKKSAIEIDSSVRRFGGKKSACIAFHFHSSILSSIISMINDAPLHLWPSPTHRSHSCLRYRGRQSGGGNNIIIIIIVMP